MRRVALCRLGLLLLASGLWLGVGCSSSDKGSDANGGGAGAVAAAGDAAGAGGATASAAGNSAGTAGASGQSAGGSTAAGAGGAGASGGTAGSAAGAGDDAGSGGSMANAGDAGTASPNAMPSTGCGNTTAPASDRYTIDVGGTMREYILKVPDGYDPSTPYRLIFAWHGRMYSADWVSNGDPPQTGPYFGIEAEANGQAIFVAPQALSSSWTNQGGRDVAFVDAMREQLESELCIDQSRIFSVGFSMGAIMTLAIGCQEGDVFRAIAPMSGSLSNGCPPADQPLAYWGSHGNNDTTIAPALGEAARDEFIKRNHCSTDTVPTEPSGCVSYQGCDPGYPVTWCPFDGVHEPPQFAGPGIWGFISPL